MTSCPNLRGQHALPGEIGKGAGDADDVALADLAVEAEQQVGRGEVEEMQRMRLQDLPVMHQPPQLFRRRRQRPETGDQVHRLGGREMMADRTDAAQPLHHDRNLPIGTALDEGFEAAKFDDMQADLMDFIVVVEQDRDLAMTFDARHRFYGDTAQSSGRGGGFECAHVGSPLNRNEAVAIRGAARARRMRSVRYFQIASPEGGQPGRK